MKTEKTTISSNTLQFLGCLQSLDEVYNNVCQAVSDMYSGSQADSIINQYWHDKFIALKGVVREFLCLSIEENLGNDTGAI